MQADWQEGPVQFILWSCVDLPLQVAAAIQAYFDAALPQLLLYDEELDDYKV